MAINGALGIINYAYTAPLIVNTANPTYFSAVLIEFSLNQNEVAELSCRITTQSPCRWWFQVDAGDITWLAPPFGQFTKFGSNTYTVKIFLQANTTDIVKVSPQFVSYGNYNPNVSEGLLFVRVVGRQA